MLDLKDLVLDSRAPSLGLLAWGLVTGFRALRLDCPVRDLKDLALGLPAGDLKALVRDFRALRLDILVRDLRAQAPYPVVPIIQCLVLELPMLDLDLYLPGPLVDLRALSPDLRPHLPAT